MMRKSYSEKIKNLAEKKSLSEEEESSTKGSRKS